VNLLEGKTGNQTLGQHSVQHTRLRVSALLHTEALARVHRISQTSRNVSELLRKTLRRQCVGRAWASQETCARVSGHRPLESSRRGAARPAHTTHYGHVPALQNKPLRTLTFDIVACTRLSAALCVRVSGESLLSGKARPRRKGITSLEPSRICCRPRGFVRGCRGPPAKSPQRAGLCARSGRRKPA